MVVNVRGRPIQPDWLRVRDEVDFVPALREFKPKFGGNDSASTVGWIACDTDLQLSAPPFSLQYCNSDRRYVSHVDEGIALDYPLIG